MPVNDTYSTAENMHMKCFTFDFKSLYDNLKQKLVKEAVQYRVANPVGVKRNKSGYWA